MRFLSALTAFTVYAKSLTTDDMSLTISITFEKSIVALLSGGTTVATLVPTLCTIQQLISSVKMPKILQKFVKACKV